jgi:hypothetical protein
LVVGGMNAVTFAARHFSRRRGARDARTLQGFARSAQRRPRNQPAGLGFHNLCGQYSTKIVYIMTPLQPCSLRVLRLFAENQRKSLSSNNLPIIASFRNQA